MPGDRLVRIFEPTGAFEVAQVRLALEGSGIPYHIENENYLQTGGGIFSLGGAQVFVVVPESRAGEARALLREWFGGEEE